MVGLCRPLCLFLFTTSPAVQKRIGLPEPAPGIGALSSPTEAISKAKSPKASGKRTALVLPVPKPAQQVLSSYMR